MDSDSDDAPLSSKVLMRPDSNHFKGVLNGTAVRHNHTAPINTKIKEESDSDEKPLISRLKKPQTSLDRMDDSDDEPLAGRLKKQANYKEESDSDVPLSKKISNAASKLKKPVTKSRSKNETATNSFPMGAKKELVKRKPVDSGSNPPKKKTKDQSVKDEVKDEDDENEEYQWWLENNKDDTIKWNTLEHNGVVFPPDYEPHGVRMLYDGKPIYLPPRAEEVASFFAALVGSDYGNNPVFQKNFFADFLKVLKECKVEVPIKEFQLCDFTPIFNYFQEIKEQKKTMTKEEKLMIKAEKEKIDEEYGWAVLDGRREKVGNFRVEPPGLFRGRGDHPKTGTLKRRVVPEQITLNLGKTAKVPPPPPGHKWGKIVHDNNVAWLATWVENVNGQIKYVLFGATSSLKGQSDMKKFEKARELKGSISKIRKDYTNDLRAKGTTVRQRATAMYLIDRLALRAGNEKGDDEADTVGCCSLRYEHVTLEPPNILKFDFLGKDSIRYVNAVEVTDQVYKNIAIFKKSPKKQGDMIFDSLNTGGLNKHLSSLMPGLSAKVFRTFNASFTFQNELENTPMDGSIHEKLLAYNRANRQVAILCNHQRSISKGFDDQMGRMEDRIKALLYQRYRLKKQILKLDPKLAKKHPELKEPEEELTDEWCISHITQLMVKEKEKAELKFDKDNLTLKEKKGKPQLQSVLKERFKEIAEEEKALIKEIKTKKVEDPKRSTTVDKLMERLEKLNLRIMAANTNKIDKDENKTTALGTSKINYIDPRISAAWCAKHKIPIDKIFNKSLRDKFKWAMEVDENYRF